MKYSVSIIGIVLMTGCSERNEFAEMDAKLAEASLDQKVTVDRLPSFPGQDDYLYQSYGKRNPFASPVTDMEALADEKTKVDAPDLSRNKEPLELFGLPSLKVVGSLGDAAKLWALVQDPTGTVTKVKVGDKVGKNFGEVVQVTESKLVIVEKISNEKGIWFSQSRTIVTEQ
jgi:type IV pilus assembly protein PilP